MQKHEAETCISILTVQVYSSQLHREKRALCPNAEVPHPTDRRQRLFTAYARLGDASSIAPADTQGPGLVFA